MGYHGIDLGTMESRIACYDERNQEARVLSNCFEASDAIESVVAFDPLDSEIAFVGAEAKSLMEDMPERGVACVKRLMGSDGAVLSLDEGSSFYPQDICALILKKIKKYGEESTNEEIRDVVVAVPAYFGESERRAIQKAVHAAGMNLRGLIPEPVAAALSYFQGYSGTTPLTALVYDLGGTFEISVVKVYFEGADRRRVEILASDSDPHLGGTEWDKELYDLVLEKVKAEDPYIDLDHEDTLSIFSKMEALKKRLSSSATSSFGACIGGSRVRVRVSREEFESRTAFLLERTRILCDRVLARLQSQDIHLDRVLLVGGSTLMPMVQALMKKMFPETEIMLSAPEHAVAKGACIAHYMYASDQPTVSEEDMAYLQKLKTVCDFLRMFDLPLSPASSEEQFLDIIRTQRITINREKNMGLLPIEMGHELLRSLDAVQALISDSEIRESAVEIVLAEKLAGVREGIDIMARAGINTYTQLDIESQSRKTGVQPSMLEQVYQEKGFHKVKEKTPFDDVPKRYGREESIHNYLDYLWHLAPDTKYKVNDLYGFMDYYRALLKGESPSFSDDAEDACGIHETALGLDRETCCAQAKEWAHDCAVNRPSTPLTSVFMRLLHECILMLSSGTSQEEYRVSMLYATCDAFALMDRVTDSALVTPRFAHARIQEIAAHFKVDERVATMIYNQRVHPLTYIPRT